MTTNYSQLADELRNAIFSGKIKTQKEKQQEAAENKGQAQTVQAIATPLLGAGAKYAGGYLYDQMFPKTVGTAPQIVEVTGSTASQTPTVAPTATSAAPTYSAAAPQIVDVTASQAPTAATQTATTSAAPQTTSSGIGGSGVSYQQLGQALAVPAAVYGIYNYAKNWDDLGYRDATLGGVATGASTGASTGTVIAPGVGTVIGGLVGGLAGAIRPATGSTKTREQRNRDIWREFAREKGLVGQDYSVGLAGGERVGIGREGINPETGRRDYEVDFAAPQAAETVGAIDPLAAITSGLASPMIKEHASGMLVNAALSAGDPTANVRKFYEDAGLDADSAYNNVLALHQEGRIDDETRNAYLASVDRVFGIQAGEERELRNFDPEVYAAQKAEQERLKREAYEAEQARITAYEERNA